MINAKRHSLPAHKTEAHRWIIHLAVLALAAAPFLIAIARVRAEPAEVAYSNTLTEAERRAGWQLLFNGRTTAGWRDYQKRTISPHWKVIDGALTLQERGGKEGLGIVFERQFENFELILEWKIGKGANSGILYRVAESQPKPYATGPEYQILDDQAHARDPKDRLCGACYAMYAPTSHPAKPVGEWNQSRLIVDGRHVEHWLNGEKIVEYEFHSPDWESRRVSGKWKSYPQYGNPTRGYICLQEHGSEVAFRSIKIRPLPASNSAARHESR